MNGMTLTEYIAVQVAYNPWVLPASCVLVLVLTWALGVWFGIVLVYRGRS